ncbi:MAG TPA: hypothetical protein PLZ21_10785, partial [Armatimonadota bacterium]|nr:hypothetical protein [Armatimonadota bacterium]
AIFPSILFMPKAGKCGLAAKNSLSKSSFHREFPELLKKANAILLSRLKNYLMEASFSPFR